MHHDTAICSRAPHLCVHSLVASLNPTLIRLEPFAAYHNKRTNMLCAPCVEGGWRGGGGDLLSQQQIPLLPARVSLSHHSNVFISGFKDMLNGYLCVMATWLRLRARCAGTSRIFAEQAVGDVDRLARGLRPPLPVEVKEGGA